jgi:hypothetical protein
MPAGGTQLTCDGDCAVATIDGRLQLGRWDRLVEDRDHRGSIEVIDGGGLDLHGSRSTSPIGHQQGSGLLLRSESESEAILLPASELGWFHAR